MNSQISPDNSLVEPGQKAGHGRSKAALGENAASNNLRGLGTVANAVLSLESKCRRLSRYGRCQGGLLLHDLRAVVARSFYFVVSVLGSRRIFGLIGFSAGFTVERIEKPIGVAGALDRPLAAPMAKEIALTMTNFDEPMDPA